MSSRGKALTPLRIFICGILPFIGRILDIVSTIYALGLGKKYVNGGVIENLENNPYAANLMEMYPDHWYLIIIAISVISILTPLVLRWLTINFNLHVKHAKYMLIIFDVGSMFIIYFSFSPVFGNLGVIHDWHTYQGGV